MTKNLRKISVGTELWTGNENTNVQFTNDQIIAPKETGIYVYSLHGDWKKGSASLNEFGKGG